jgi:hypothetical protein
LGSDTAGQEVELKTALTHKRQLLSMLAASPGTGLIFPDGRGWNRGVYHLRVISIPSRILT